MSLFWCGLLHEGGDLLARGCAHCTKVLPTWSTPNPPAVAPDPRAVHAQGQPSGCGRPGPSPSGEPAVDFLPRTAQSHGSLAREDEEEGRSGLAQQDPAHAVLGVLGQDQGGPAPGGGDVLAQVDQVDALPDLVRSG